MSNNETVLQQAMAEFEANEINPRVATLVVASRHTGNVEFRGNEDAVVDFLNHTWWVQPHVEIRFPGGLVILPENFTDVKLANKARANSLAELKEREILATLNHRLEAQA